MKEINVTGQKRSDLGKKATKQLRKKGLVPCNLYGEAKDENGKPKALAFAVPMTDLRKLVYTPHIYVVNLVIDGENHPAIMKGERERSARRRRSDRYRKRTQHPRRRPGSAWRNQKYKKPYSE